MRKLGPKSVRLGSLSERMGIVWKSPGYQFNYEASVSKAIRAGLAREVVQKNGVSKIVWKEWRYK